MLFRALNQNHIRYTLLQHNILELINISMPEWSKTVQVPNEENCSKRMLTNLQHLGKPTEPTERDARKASLFVLGSWLGTDEMELSLQYYAMQTFDDKFKCRKMTTKITITLTYLNTVTESFIVFQFSLYGLITLFVKSQNLCINFQFPHYNDLINTDY